MQQRQLLAGLVLSPRFRIQKIWDRITGERELQCVAIPRNLSSYGPKRHEPAYSPTPQTRSSRDQHDYPLIPWKLELPVDSKVNRSRSHGREPVVSEAEGLALPSGATLLHANYICCRQLRRVLVAPRTPVNIRHNLKMPLYEIVVVGSICREISRSG